MNRLVRWIFVYSLFAFATACLQAQTVAGTLVGTVTDASGGTVPRASVVVRNVDTNQMTATQTGGTGDYSVPNLQPGNYEITIAANGYKKVRVPDIRLQLSTTQRTDVRLDVGSEAAVEVTAAPAEISTDTSSIADVIDMKSAEDLPLNGRTVDRLIMFAPGSTGESSSNPNIGGSQHWGGAYFTVDGGAFNDVGNGGGAYSYATNLTTMPSTEVIQEMRVETNLAKAESPAGTSIAILTKSGTNRFHGSLYEFNRNRVMAARDYFSRVGVIAKPPYNRNEFGFIFDGPIWKDRTFFLASAEYLLQRQSKTNTMSVPTDAMRQGNFAGLAALKDPTNKGLPFPNNQLPSIDPRAAALIKFYPEPNQPGTDVTGTANDLVQNDGIKYDVKRYGLKFDHQLTPMNQLTIGGNYSIGDPYQVAQSVPTNYGNWANAGYYTQSAFIRDTATIGHSMVNESRVGYFSHRSIRVGQNTDYDPTKLFPTLYGPLPIGGLPTVNITGYTKIGDYGGAGHNFTTLIQPVDNFTWQHGRHTFKTGADINLIALGVKSGVGAASLGTFTSAAGSRYTGNAFADFLLGYISSDTRATPSEANTAHYEQYGLYVQDDWQVNSRLTLNIGFRYDLQTTERQRDGDVTNFDPATGKYVIRSVNGKISDDAANSPALKLALYPFVTSEANGWGSTMLFTDKKNFGPRLGFAFRPYGGQSTVVRGGYGIYYNYVPFFIGPNQLTTVNYPFSLTETFTATSSSTPSLTLANPFPGQGTVTANPTAYMVDRQLKNARIQQWNLTVEQIIPGRIGLRLTYLGNRGTQIPWYGFNENLPYPQRATSTKEPTLQAERPYQPWGDISALVTKGKAFTNQMQVVANKQARNGIFLQSSFTWSKSMDNVPVSGTPENPYRPQDDWGNADTQHALNFYLSASYKLPFKGHGLKGGLIGGWQLSTMTAWHSGLPFTPTFTSGVVGWYATRASVVPGVSPYAANKTLTNWLNPAAFKKPDPFTFGTARRNSLIGPGEYYSDVSVLKSFAIHEKLNLQLRMDAFNVLNHPNFGNPGANISVGTFGTITGTLGSGPNRLVQLGGRLRF
ncbi:MAG: carboxypeptidase regulatory-like domain-containing protein [Acidobacteriota bacterium]